MSSKEGEEIKNLPEKTVSVRTNVKETQIKFFELFTYNFELNFALSVICF